MESSENLSPVVQRRRLRTELRRARLDAQLTQEQVATAMDWSLSKLIRIENGTVGIPAPWVKKRRVINQPLSDPANGARPSSSQMPGSMTRGLK